MSKVSEASFDTARLAALVAALYAYHVHSFGWLVVAVVFGLIKIKISFSRRRRYY